MDTCAEKFSITFKMLRYIVSGSDNFLGCILCTPTLHFRFIMVSEYMSHKCICVGVRYYRWPSCKLPCFLLSLTPSTPNDASSLVVHLSSRSKPDKACLGKAFHRNTPGTRRHPQHPPKHELRDSHWYQGTHSGTEGRMLSTDKAPLDLSRVVLDLKTPLR